MKWLLIGLVVIALMGLIMSIVSDSPRSGDPFDVDRL